MSPKSMKYERNEKVLCYHGSMIYEAKIRDVDPDEKLGRYFVHYMGWNNKWDEWVDDSRILKYSESNLDTAKEVNSQNTSVSTKKGMAPGSRKQKSNDSEKTPSHERPDAGQDAPAAAEGKYTFLEVKDNTDKTPEKPVDYPVDIAVTEEPTHSKSSVVKGGSKRADGLKHGSKKGDDVKDGIKKSDTVKDSSRKRSAKGSSGRVRKKEARNRQSGASGTQRKLVKSGSSAKTKKVTPKKRLIRLRLPEGLKQIMREDFDMISKKGKLMMLPASATVSTIIEDYLYCKYEFVENTNEPEVNLGFYVEAANGIKSYFDALLGYQLLYQCERQQYEDILQRYADTPMSDVYGYPHLVRMFFRLGEVVNSWGYCSRSNTVIESYTVSFIKYLNERRSELFSQHLYEATAVKYHGDAA